MVTLDQVYTYIKNQEDEEVSTQLTQLFKDVPSYKDGNGFETQDIPVEKQNWLFRRVNIIKKIVYIIKVIK
jgi:hypothetical protein